MIILLILATIFYLCAYIYVVKEILKYYFNFESILELIITTIGVLFLWLATSAFIVCLFSMEI